MTLCLDRPGRVHVTSVVPTDGDLDVTGYALAVHATPDFAGDLDKTLTEAGISPGPDPLTVVCRDALGGSYELLVELRAGTRSTASSGFTVKYVSEGQPGELELPYRVIMCLHPGDSACALR